MSRRAAAPIGEFELDDADGVLGKLAQAARLLADARVHGLEAVEGEHPLLDSAEHPVLLVERNIAAGVHDHLAEIGLDIGKELDAAAELAIGRLHRNQQEGRERECRAGMAQRQPHRAHIGPVLRGALVMGHPCCLAQ